MVQDSPHITHLLNRHDIRPTKIRCAVAALLFDGMDKHVTVDNVIAMARAENIKTSIASVYNTLNQFTEAGLLRRVNVGAGRVFFDTNLTPHYHFYYEDEERLEDIAQDDITLSQIPELPCGRPVKSIEITVKV